MHKYPICQGLIYYKDLIWQTQPNTIETEAKLNLPFLVNHHNHEKV